MGNFLNLRAGWISRLKEPWSASSLLSNHIAQMHWLGGADGHDRFDDHLRLGKGIFVGQRQMNKASGSGNKFSCSQRTMRITVPLPPELYDAFIGW
jgi:hypothetical protein